MGVLIIAVTGWFMLRKAPATVDADLAARRLVKTGSDPEAREIGNEVHDISISDLVATKAPAKLGKRSGSFERTKWRISGTIETIEKKKDGDFYLVVKDEGTKRTVVEVPDPELCKSSPFHDTIAETRKALDERFHPTPKKQSVGVAATLEGVGFLGWGSSRPKKGSSGLAGPRLMPGTKIKFGS